MGRKNKAESPEAKLEEKKNEILKRAEAMGASDNYFFQTTFERYETQLKILAKLKYEVENGDVLVEKHYVKGESNLCVNPAIREYNATASAANGTVTTLAKILNTLAVGESDGATDPLIEYSRS